MKIIHCADIHLDSKLNSNFSEEVAKSRKLEVLHTFVKMMDYAKENKIPAILIAGDLFDTKNVSALSRNTFLDAVNKNPDIKFFYLRGNHDENALLTPFDELPSNLFLFNDTWTDYTVGESGNVVIHGAELNGENSGLVQNSFNADPSKINIVMLHGQESLSSGKDTTAVINLKLFRNKGIDYLALGHVHAYKRCNLDARGVYCYCGCLEGRAFDEPGDHGFVILDVDEENGTVSDTFVSFAYRHICEVETDVTGCVNTAEMIERAKTELKNSDARDIDIVNLILKGSIEVECEAEPEFIRHYFEEDYYFLKVTDATKLVADPSKYMMDTSLKGEFVREVLASESLSDDDKNEILKLGLNVLMGGKPEL